MNKHLTHRGLYPDHPVCGGLWSWNKGNWTSLPASLIPFHPPAPDEGYSSPSARQHVCVKSSLLFSSSRGLTQVLISLFRQKASAQLHYPAVACKISLLLSDIHHHAFAQLRIETSICFLCVCICKIRILEICH